MAMSVAALVLGGLNVALSLANGAEATRVAQRRDAIAQTPQLARVTQITTSALAGPAGSDAAIRELLQGNGVAVAAPAAPR